MKESVLGIIKKEREKGECVASDSEWLTSYVGVHIYDPGCYLYVYRETITMYMYQATNRGLIIFGVVLI